MVKKNTWIIFEGKTKRKPKRILGGIPLSKGETIKVHEGKKIKHYKVNDKVVDCFFAGNNQTVNITYFIKENKV